MSETAEKRNPNPIGPNTNFRHAANDLVKFLDRDQKKEGGHLSSVNGHLAAANDAAAEPTAGVGVPVEAAPAEAGLEAKGAGLGGAEQGLAEGPDAGPLPEDRRKDGFFAPKPEELGIVPKANSSA